jgi:DDE superfamily endonuclease
VAKGRMHDFRIFKESKTALLPSIESLTDSGYQGIQKIHANCVKPVKGTKKRPLSKEDKKYNHHLGSKRVMVEHIIRELKIFKIIAAPYRNRRKRFGLRINLIAAIYNFEL